MPQEPAGCVLPRKPALALLVGLALLLMAHVMACAAHAAESHLHPAAAASSTHAESGADVADVPRWVSDVSDCSTSGDADGHPGHDVSCCDPADWPANLRAPAGALLLALSLLALLALRRRAADPATSCGPPGPGETVGALSPGGPPLLRLVCVSRT
ncbi:hypothetical protein [Streptomyces sp. NPDC001530]|uniref:hypothetical protein n=1 Tax=Streptomyces sp. NPDC001530 TaxID=3364582 RepID=UPI00368D6859